MPTQKRRVNLTVDDEMWDMLMEHRNRGRFMSVASAAIDLIERGAEAYRVKTPLTIAANADGLTQENTSMEINGALKEIHALHKKKPTGKG